MRRHGLLLRHPRGAREEIALHSRCVNWYLSNCLCSVQEEQHTRFVGGSAHRRIRKCWGGETVVVEGFGRWGDAVKRRSNLE